MQRAFRTLTALVAWSGLGIQLWIMLASGNFDTAGDAVWRFVAFFTVLCNLMVALVSTASALAPRSALGRIADRAGMRAAVFVYMSTVGITYHLILAGLWDPQGWQLVADQLLHTASPLLVALGWFVFDNKQGLSFRLIPACLIFPVGYTLYALARGMGDGFYPYPFIDAGQIGYARTFQNIAGLTGAFIAGSALVILLGKFLAGLGVRTAPAA